jgi:hypothetical protein
MPCTSRTILAVARINLKDVDVQLAREAFKLMYPQGVLTLVKDFGRNALTLRFNGQTTTIEVSGNDLKAIGSEAPKIGAKFDQYYLAVVRAALMRADGMQTQVQVVGDKIRITARG